MALTGALALTGCAKVARTSGTGAEAGGEGCKLAPIPEATLPSASTTASNARADASSLRVGLAFDVGGRGDASFNDAAAAGLDRAKAQMGVKDTKELTAAQGESTSAQEARLTQLASEGYNPVISVGFNYSSALQKVSAQFPNTRFAIVDDDSVKAPNVTPLVFAEEQGSFLAGVVAAYKSKNCHVGFVGGVNTPLIQKFDAGFVTGAKAAAPGIKIERKYLTPAGDNSGFQDPAKGTEVATGQLDAGADVIYHAAGASGKGVFAAAKQRNALAIGVDSDQYNQPNVAAEKDIIITSMIKRVDVAVFDYLAAVTQNTIGSLPKKFDLKADGVGYATSGGRVDSMKSVLDAYQAEIISGKITVSDRTTG